LCKELEILGRGNTIGNAEVIVNQMDAEYKRVIASLSQTIGGQSCCLNS